MGVTYADPEPDIQDEIRTKIIDLVGEDAHQKPWNLVESVTEEGFNEEQARRALKELMLEGKVEIASTGEVRATRASV